MAADTDSQEKKALAIKALERRNAAEKLQQQKIISKPKPPHVGGKSSTKEDSSSTTPSKQVPVSFWTSNSTHLQDAGDNCESYFELSHPVHENLLKPDAKSNGEASSMVSKILHDLFQRGDYGHKYLQGWKRMKIDNCILLDNHVRRSKNPDYHIKALKTFSKRSKKHMSRKQHKKCGSFDLPQHIRKFNVFKPMHEMWKGYMRDLLKNTGMNQSDVAQCLLNADLHGAIILVAECKVTSFTGVSGIMISETAETFGIITQDDKLQVVPKKFSVFIFEVGNWKITLHGDKLTSRKFGL